MEATYKFVRSVDYSKVLLPSNTFLRKENGNMENNNINENNLENGTIDYNMGTVPAKPNIVLGILGALVGAILGGVLWGLISMTGTIFTAIAILIAWLTIFLYEKMAKGIDIKGIVICAILSLVSVYLSTRISSVFIIIREFKDSLGWNLSYSQAREYLSNFSEIKDAYYHDLILSLVFAIVGVALAVTNKFKKIKNTENQNKVIR